MAARYQVSDMDQHGMVLSNDVYMHIDQMMCTCKQREKGDITFQILVSLFHKHGLSWTEIMPLVQPRLKNEQDSRRRFTY